MYNDKLDKWLYFRSVTDMANDDGDEGSNNTSPTSLCIPADSLVGMAPVSDTAISITFESCRSRKMNSRMGTGTHTSPTDEVLLEVTQGKTADVMKGIVQAIDGFLVIADECVTTDSATTALNDLAIAADYIHPDITGVGAITCNIQPGGYGIHEYYEVVTPATADNNDVAASLSVKIPAQAVLLDAAITSVEKAGSNHGALALEYHNAAIADDAASGGTEWVGADAANDLSIPDANLDLDNTAGVLGATVYSGNAQVAVARGTAETFIHLCAKEDLSSMTGTPKVGVYVRWIGSPAILL